MQSSVTVLHSQSDQSQAIEMFFTPRLDSLLLTIFMASRLLCSGAPLWREDRRLPSQPLGEPPSPSEPVRVLRATDSDVIIQIFRPAGQEEGGVSRNRHIKKTVDESVETEGDRGSFESSGEVVAGNRTHRVIKLSTRPFAGRPGKDGFNEGNVKISFADFSTRRGRDNKKDPENERNFKTRQDDENDGYIPLQTFNELTPRANPKPRRDETFEEGSLRSPGERVETSPRQAERDISGSDKPHLSLRNLTRREEMSLKTLGADAIEAAGNGLLEKVEPTETSGRLRSGVAGQSAARPEDAVATVDEGPQSRRSRFESPFNDHHLVFDQKEPLPEKVIQVRSSPIESLQDLKRRLQLKPDPLPLLGRGPALLGPPSLPPLLSPPPLAPLNLRPDWWARGAPTTEDPVTEAERAQTNLQRMILFVNAMGKLDYYVSNAAKNLVGLLTQHTNDYDQTVRSRIGDKEGCLNTAIEDEDRQRGAGRDEEYRDRGLGDKRTAEYRRNAPLW